MKVTSVKVELLDAPPWGNAYGVMEIFGITLTNPDDRKAATSALKGTFPAISWHVPQSFVQQGTFSGGVPDADPVPVLVEQDLDKVYAFLE